MGVLVVVAGLVLLVGLVLLAGLVGAGRQLEVLLVQSLLVGARGQPGALLVGLVGAGRQPGALLVQKLLKLGAARGCFQALAEVG